MSPNVIEPGKLRVHPGGPKPKEKPNTASKLGGPCSERS